MLALALATLLFSDGDARINKRENETSKYNEYLSEVITSFLDEMKYYGIHSAKEIKLSSKKGANISIFLTTADHPTLIQARQYELFALTRFIELSKSHVKLQPLLKKFPIKWDELQIAIQFHQPNGSFYSDGSISHVKLNKSEFHYETYVGHKNKNCEIACETVLKAVKNHEDAVEGGIGLLSNHREDKIGFVVAHDRVQGKLEDFEKLAAVVSNNLNDGIFFMGSHFPIEVQDEYLKNPDKDPAAIDSPYMNTLCTLFGNLMKEGHKTNRKMLFAFIAFGDGSNCVSKSISQVPSERKELLGHKALLLSIGPDKPTPKQLALEVFDIYYLENETLQRKNQYEVDPNDMNKSIDAERIQFLAHFNRESFFVKGYQIELREKLDDYKREYGSYGRPRK